MCLDLQAISHPITGDDDAPFDPVVLATAIVRRHGVTLEAVRGPDRHQHISAARKAVYAALRARGWSYPEIAKFCNRKDHTTIMYGLYKRGTR